MTRQLGLFNSGMDCRNTAVVGTGFRFSLLSIKWKCLMYSENTVQKIKLNGAPYIHFYVLFWQERDILLYTNVYCIQGHTFDMSYYHIYFSSLWEEQPIQREIYSYVSVAIIQYKSFGVTYSYTFVSGMPVQLLLFSIRSTVQNTHCWLLNKRCQN